jgi:hypothetical protein
MSRFRNIENEPPFPNGLHQLAYDRLNLKAFLQFLYPDKDLHTTLYTAGSIQEDLRITYREFTQNNSGYFFQTWGSLTDVPLLSMKYYQDEIDLRGRHPKNGGIEEPVWVVQYSNATVLFNGYHRASMTFLLGKETIQAYVVKVEHAGLTQK